MSSCMSDIEHYRNEYENGRMRGIWRNNPLGNKLGMLEDGLSYSPIKVLALTFQGYIARTYLTTDALHCFYFVELPLAYPFSVHIPSVIIPYLSIQMLFLCIRHSKGRWRLLIVEEHKQSIWKR